MDRRFRAATLGEKVESVSSAISFFYFFLLGVLSFRSPFVTNVWFRTWGAAGFTGGQTGGRICAQCFMLFVRVCVYSRGL